MNFFFNKQLFIVMKIILTESQYKHLISEGFNFDLEYKRLYPKIFRQICLRYANGDKEKANDFCQLGFIKVHQKMGMYDGSGSLEGWIQRIIKNTIIDELRKEKRSPKRKDVDFGREDLDLEDMPNEEPMFSMSDIKDAMETLSPSYKRIFNMYYFEDMSHQEIADELGISDGTSKSNLFKAKANVKSYLEKLNKKREG
jgi:RNA polymerase sigma factor (sigma-70 family)